MSSEKVRIVTFFILFGFTNKIKKQKTFLFHKQYKVTWGWFRLDLKKFDNIFPCPPLPF